MTEDSRSEKKFAHLLQPIRSLSDNWDIDLAAELEEYLEDLEELTFSFEGGPTLNFAEAALLIQGSTCVYSRKVEYLHGLVYRALEVIADSKRKQNRSKAGAGEDGQPADDEADFLCLDNAIEEGTGIDLDEGSMKGPAAAIRPPAALLALEDAGVQGEGHGDGEDGNFKIAFCHVHSSGALLLEQHDAGPTQEEQQYARDEQPMSPGGAEYDDAGTAEDDWQGHSNADMTVPDEVCEMGTTATPQANELDQQPFEAQPPPEESIPRPMDPSSSCAGEEDAGHEHQEVFDPYKPLDMYDSGSHKRRPFRRMRIRPQPSIDDCVHQDLQARVFRIPPAAVNGCTYPEFNYALEALRLSEATLVRQAKRLNASNKKPIACFTAFDAQGDVDPAEEEDEGDLPLDCGDDHDDGDGFADPLDPLDNLAEDSVDQCLSTRAAEALGEDAMECLSYEDLCKAHIDAFIARAAAAEVQTDLASRVSAWQSKMEPALELQNAQGAFDIHEYGESILANLECASGAERKPVGFELAVVGSEKYQVSRTFSAMLQLINNGNVIIHRGEDTATPFQLELVTTELAHKQMGVSGALGFQCTARPSALTASQSFPPSENVDSNLQARDDRSHAPKAARTSAQPGRSKAMKR